MSYAAKAAGASAGASTEVKTEGELLRNIKGTLAETTDISKRTMTTLDHQDEQLSKIHNDAENIGHNLDQSEWLLRSLKPFGWVRNMWRKDRPEEISPRDNRDKASPIRGSTNSAGGRGAQRLLADEARRTESAKSKSEHDAMYDDIDNMLDELKVQSETINSTLEKHNKMLPTIADKLQTNQDKLQKQSKEITRQLR
eukprot:CAMPEP_0194478678 /NCGR_PEP_ID=MMETSP0253-20130528/2046_1 /TAXON_ID=2966 /ORGANISM="Noctiluca scintillans" /LENGTH=197 /DNA_ID=CAMNT_0039317793 /DNA_START=58 /DNA_END=651 /DNA_ORIENTATION=+